MNYWPGHRSQELLDPPRARGFNWLVCGGLMKCKYAPLKFCTTLSQQKRNSQTWHLWGVAVANIQHFINALKNDFPLLCNKFDQTNRFTSLSLCFHHNFVSSINKIILFEFLSSTHKVSGAASWALKSFYLLLSMSGWPLINESLIINACLRKLAVKYYITTRKHIDDYTLLLIYFTWEERTLLIILFIISTA